MARELVIYCDESVSNGEFFSNFYGGLLVESQHVEPIRTELTDLKTALGITGEIKWERVNTSVADRYIEFMTSLFALVGTGRIKIRVMFTQNRHVATLTPEQRETGYTRLYYQFIKHAFGLQCAGTPGEATRLRLMLDQLPANREQVARFRGYLSALTHQPDFRRAQIEVPREQIAEIDSKEHILAQALDVVLGSMAFYLNDRHLAKPAGARIRSKRTREKERVYKHINACIRKIYPRFNVGVSTGQPNGPSDRWNHAYRHWLFVPKGAGVDNSLTKRKKPRDRYG